MASQAQIRQNLGDVNNAWGYVQAVLQVGIPAWRQQLDRQAAAVNRKRRF